MSSKKRFIADFCHGKHVAKVSERSIPILSETQELIDVNPHSLISFLKTMELRRSVKDTIPFRAIEGCYCFVFFL